MKTVSIFEAKAHFAALLNRVAKGEKIAITRRGVPAALLVPVSENGSRLSHRDVVEGMRALRERVKPDEMNVRELIEEGRHF